MEQMVLKTIIIFLNLDGRNLLIGVVDDDLIIGIDLQSFNSRDKFNLHLTNLIFTQIGNGYLPYTSFNMVDFNGDSMVRVKCNRCVTPVFLGNGKIKIFYIPSEPSTVELTGMKLINYVNDNQSGDTRKTISVLKNLVDEDGAK